MPFFYKIDKGHRLVLSTGSGVLSRGDVLSHQEKLLKDPEFDPSFSQIADFSQITQFDIAASDIRELAEKAVFSPQSHRAIIVPTEFGYGLGRMFEILRGTAGDQGIRVFRNLEEALDWVLSKDMTT